MKRNLIGYIAALAGVVISAGVVGGAAASAPQYTAQDLGVPSWSVANAINTRGGVIGYSEAGHRRGGSTTHGTAARSSDSM